MHPKTFCFHPKDQVRSEQVGQCDQSAWQGEEGDHPTGGWHQVLWAWPEEVQRQGWLISRWSDGTWSEDEGVARGERSIGRTE